MNKNQKRTLIILVVLFLLVVVIFTYNEILKKEKPKVKIVKYTVAEKLYEQVPKQENTKEREYIYKLYGYTTDQDGNILLDVKEAYIENDFVYDLSNKKLGTYNKETIDKLLDQATTKKYTFNKKANNYKLIDNH